MNQLIKNLFPCLFILALSIGAGNAQQTTVELNSDSQSSATNGNGPHLLLLETGDAGNGQMGGGTNDDGFVRLWFRNSSDITRTWALNARPQLGAVDNDGILIQPFIMAHNGVQKFGFGSDGTLRINKKYSLPTGDVNRDNRVIIQDDDGTSTWGFLDYTSKDASTTDETFQLHEQSNGAAVLTFSNQQNPNSRWFLRGDPTTTGVVNAQLRLGWTNQAAIDKSIMILDAKDYNIGINTPSLDDVTLYVQSDVDKASQTAAHFEPYATGSKAFVTINKPSAVATTIFRCRDNNSTVLDVDDDAITFFEKTVVRDDLDVLNSDITLTGSGGILKLDQVMNMPPSQTDPASCVEGDVYLQSNATGTNYKFRVCNAAGTWIDL